MIPVVIEFPAPAPLLNMNQRTHWRVQRAHARAWRHAAAMYTLEQLGHGRSQPPAVVSIELPVLGARRRDPHNYFPTVKPVVDGLVDAGLWPDDTPEWVTTVEPALKPYTSRAEMVVNARVRITLTPRAAP